MIKKLADGTVLPANLSNKPLPDARQILMADYSLKMGIVNEVIYPDQSSSLSGKYIEYTVLVNDINANGNVAMRAYRNCLLNNIFGMSNNNLTYVLQTDSPDNAEDGNIKTGSLVLLLCMSGQSSGGQAVIIGGISHPSGPDYTSADGTFYDFNFNGINYNINNDGEWTLTFNSVIDSSGNQANSAAAGTAIKIDKEGRVKISDNAGQFWELDRVAKTSTWSNGSESILIDLGNHAVTLNSSGTMSSISNKAMSMTSQDAMNMTSSKATSITSNDAVNVSSQANTLHKSGAGWQVQATGNVNIQAGGNVSINGGSQAQIQGAITIVGSGGAQAAGVGISEVLTYVSGVPCIGQIITGSATVMIGT